MLIFSRFAFFIRPVVILINLCCLFCFAPLAQAFIYYVAPAPLGSDSYDGLSLERPFATIQKAASQTNALSVVIRGGVYRETVKPVKDNVVFSAYKTELVTINGSKIITDWSVYAGSSAGGLNGNGGNNIYTSRGMNWTLNSGLDDQVFVDGVMMNHARHPNNPRNELLTHPRLTMDSATIPAYVKDTRRLAVVSDSELTEGTDFYKDSVLHMLGSGSDNHTYGMGLTNVVTTSRSGQLTIDLIDRDANDKNLPRANVLYYLSGKANLLDSPGEWFRLSTGELLLWTPSGAAPSAHVVEARERDYGFDLSGRSNITLRGLRFFACSIFTDINSRNNLLENLDIVYPSHFGRVSKPYEQGVATLDWNGNPSSGAGVYLTGTNNTLQNSSVAYTPGSAVAVGGLNNKVLNNIIHDIAYMGVDGGGVSAGQNSIILDVAKHVRGAEIANNTIYNASRALLQLRGLYAGYVHHNHLWYGMLNTFDYGAIYALNHDHWGTGARTNGLGGGFTRISRNRIHSTPPQGGKDGIGIYLDNDSYDYVVDHNVAWGSTASIMMTATTYDPVGDTEARVTIDPTSTADINFSGNITFAVWLKPTVSTLTDARNIVRQGPQGDKEIFFRVVNQSYELGSSQTDTTVTPNKKTTNFASYPIPAADYTDWVHYAGVYNGTQWQLYRNGVLVAFKTASFGAVTFSTTKTVRLNKTIDRNWEIGGMNELTEEMYSDYIDDFRLYRGALTASQILGLSQGKTPTVTFKQLFFDFESVSDRDVFDKSVSGSTKKGIASYKNVKFEKVKRAGNSNNYALRCPPSAAWRGMHIYNNTVLNGIGYGWEDSPKVNSTDPQSKFINNVTLDRSTHLWWAVARGKPSDGSVRTAAGLVNRNNVTTYGNPGNPGLTSLTSMSFTNSSLNDYRITGTTSSLRTKGIGITLSVPDTTKSISNGAYPTKLLEITAPGVTKPDLGAFEGGDWVSGATSLANGDLPNGWARRDIGIDSAMGPTGYTAVIGSNYYVSGGGNGIGLTTDGFHYTYTSLLSNGDLTATLQHQEVSNQSSASRAGLMLRASPSDSDSYASLTLSPGRGVVFETRRSTPATPTVAFQQPVSGGSSLAVNTTHALVANASSIGGAITEVVFRVDGAYLGKGFSSPYTTLWTPTKAGTYTLTAVATNNVGASSSASSVTVTVATEQLNPTVALIAPAASSISQVGLPVTLTAHADVVSTTAITDVRFRVNGRYLSKDSTSPYSAVWTPTVPGTYNLTAEVVDNSTPSKIVTSTSIPVTITAEVLPPITFKISRVGDTLTGSYRSGTSDWVVAGETTDTNLPDLLLAGLAVSSHNQQRLTTAIFSSVMINQRLPSALRTGLDEWLGSKYPNTADTSAYLQSIPAGQTMSNLMAYALGVAPTGVPTPSTLPSIDLTVPDSKNQRYPTLSFTQRVIAPTGIRYTVEESTDLVKWTALNSTANQVGTPVVIDAELQRVTVRANTPVIALTPKVFLRLKVEPSP
jgi:hypothetical protein